MPVTISAKRKLRADARKEQTNQKVREQIKSALKKFKAVPTIENLGQAYSILDVAAKKKVIAKQRADRKKGRLSRFIAKKGLSKPKDQKPKEAKARKKRSSQKS